MRTALVATCFLLFASVACSEDDKRPPLIPDAESLGLRPPGNSIRGGVGTGGSASNDGTAGAGGFSGSGLAGGAGLGGGENTADGGADAPDAGLNSDAGP